MTTPAEVTVQHITIRSKGDRIDAECSKCGQGIDVGARFGPIPGETLIAEWVKQHAHKPRGRRKP